MLHSNDCFQFHYLQAKFNCPYGCFCFVSGDTSSFRGQLYHTKFHPLNLRQPPTPKFGIPKMSYSNLVFCAQLLVTTVVLLQSCGTWTVVSGAVWTPSTTTTATVAIAMTTAQPLATTTVAGGNASVASSITSGPPAVVRGANREGRAWSFGMMQKYDLPGGAYVF